MLRVEAGNFGDCEPVGDGVTELRIHVGSQAADIKRAKDYWADWKRRQA